jgi:hypothetical protein
MLLLASLLYDCYATASTLAQQHTAKQRNATAA